MFADGFLRRPRIDRGAVLVVIALQEPEGFLVEIETGERFLSFAGGFGFVTVGGGPCALAGWTFLRVSQAFLVSAVSLAMRPSAALVNACRSAVAWPLGKTMVPCSHA